MKLEININFIGTKELRNQVTNLSKEIIGLEKQCDYYRTQVEHIDRQNEVLVKKNDLAQRNTDILMKIINLAKNIFIRMATKNKAKNFIQRTNDMIGEFMLDTKNF